MPFHFLALSVSQLCLRAPLKLHLSPTPLLSDFFPLFCLINSVTLKYLTVLLGAGMLAFLGAIICIIASIAPGSPGAVPGAGDEEGASYGSDGGAGAVHGSEADRPRPTAPSKATVFQTEAGKGSIGSELGQGSVLGSDSDIGITSRFLCLPLAQDCPSPSIREDLLLMRSTADHLRQMVIQQEQQILNDQETIRELTGKLSRCENGQELDSFQNNPEEYAWDAGRNSLEDGTEDSEHTIQELEHSVYSLKNNIEKLEIQELEAQLLSKLSELEKERSLLRNKSDRQKHLLEEQLESLHQRIDKLEKETAVYKLQEGYKISFPVRTNYMYARMKQSLPELYALTVCLWLKSKDTVGIGTPFSYAVPGQANELVLLEWDKNPIELLINDKVTRLPLEIKDGEWHHVCITWTTRDGVWEVYEDGKWQGSGNNLAPWHPIKPGGTLVLGQEQDVAGGSFDATQAFVGELAEFNIWDRILTPMEIQNIANCSTSTVGNIISWEGSSTELFGGATKWPFQRCDVNKDSEQD
ncbi:neuronal pentraxin-2-like isoform X2 [Stegostoma tigrinum]|uniref:neuronal pentraxin-2-like isoform X2 n=1 Tax=Stegostoma tigrinum TaxID=3053191 RepID=UPI00202B2620|nr:neuronal pentraxin-2-like isoform X2 [Stegostoma tigrinum]